MTPAAAGGARPPATPHEHKEGPRSELRGPSFVRGDYLVSGDSFGSLAYASAALALVTATGGSR